jgi:hypothetical protein
MVTDLNLTDMETGYKAFRIEVVKHLTLESKRFDVEPEITAKIARLGCRVYEVPISYHGRTYAEGKKIRWTDAVAAIGAIMKYGLLPARASQPARFGSPSTTEPLQSHSNRPRQDTNMSELEGDAADQASCDRMVGSVGRNGSTTSSVH